MTCFPSAPPFLTLSLLSLSISLSFLSVHSQPSVQAQEQEYKKLWPCDHELNLIGDAPRQDRYISVGVKGGFNQQRKGIANAVVLAHMLNASLVVPTFEKHEVWHVELTMDGIFDVDWFIKTLEKYVTVVRKLPDRVNTTIYLPEETLENAPNYLTERSIIEQFKPSLDRFGSVGLHHWHVQLVENLPRELQQVRCLANFKALKFRQGVSVMGEVLVEALRKKGDFIVVHMRFEQDWLVYSKCEYHQRLQIAVPLARNKSICPLSPMEISIILKALQLSDNTSIYIASGNIVGGSKTLAPLQNSFPGRIFRKDDFSESLGKFEDVKEVFITHGAIIDHLVAVASNLVIVTDGRSNWGHMVEGERFYSSGNHKETLVLDPGVLRPYVSNASRDWENAKMRIAEYRKSYRLSGCRRETRNPATSFCYPIDCMCKQTI